MYVCTYVYAVNILYVIFVDMYCINRKVTGRIFGIHNAYMTKFAKTPSLYHVARHIFYHHSVAIPMN